MKVAKQNRKNALEGFDIYGEFVEAGTYGSGHINDTFLVVIDHGEEGVKRYILQRMNREIFKSPEELMDNIMNVTTYLRERIVEAGGNPERETLNVIPSKEGKSYYLDDNGEYWRMYQFIEGAQTYDLVENPEIFYESAVSFGHFQRMLADYPADTLYETIKDFHNTPDRYEKLMAAVEADICSRVASVQEEIQFAMDRKADTSVLADLLKAGKLPLRVTHNDTKLNNIMIDDVTHKGICVIDLDTVMPGLALNDYGDSIRFGASTGAEDEVDLSKVSCSMELFELYTKGFIEGCGGRLTQTELELMPMGAKLMTLECGMRFLTDYLSGDTYFKIHRPNHNLDRARTQFKLVKDMEEKWDEMQAIVKKYV